MTDITELLEYVKQQKDRAAQEVCDRSLDYDLSDQSQVIRWHSSLSRWEAFFEIETFIKNMDKDTTS